MTPINTAYNGYLITTDKALMHPHDVYQWLSERSYWAKGIPLETFRQSFDNSFAIGALIDGKQVGYARLVTDYATFGYLADVYVEEGHQGNGLGKIMMETLLNFDWVKKLRRIMLATRDAQYLYRKYSFENCLHPERVMEIVRPDIYENS